MEQETYPEYKDPEVIIKQSPFLDYDQKSLITRIFQEQLERSDIGRFRICTDDEYQVLISTYQYLLNIEESSEEQKLIAGIMLHSFQPMILNILKRHSSDQDIPYHTQEDMLQEANIRVLRCFSNYNPQKGARLNTYVYRNALAGLTRERNSSRGTTFHLPEPTLYTLRKIRTDIENGMNVKEALDRHTNRDDREDFQYLLNLKRISLDSNSHEDDRDRHFLFSDPKTESIEDTVEFRLFVKELFAKCKPKQIELLRYIMLGYKYKDIAKIYNVTPRSVRQRANTLAKNLRKKLST